MRKPKNEEVFRNLKNTKIGLFLTNYQYLEGFLLDFKQDYLVIEVDGNIYYAACEHIQAISKNTKDFYVSSKEVTYLNREYLSEILDAMLSTWVIINDSGNQVYNGVVSRIIEDYIILIDKQELHYIPKSLITNIYSAITEDQVKYKNSKKLMTFRQTDAIQKFADQEHVLQLEKDSEELSASSVDIDKETYQHDADTREKVEIISEDTDVTISTKHGVVKNIELAIEDEKVNSESISNIEEVNATFDLRLVSEPESLSNSGQVQSEERIAGDFDVDNELIELSTTPESMDSIDSHEDKAINLQIDVNQVKEYSVSDLTNELEEPRQSSTNEELAEVEIEENAEEVREMISTNAKVELPAKLELMKILYLTIDDKKIQSQSMHDKDSLEKYDTHLEQEPEQLSSPIADDEIERALPDKKTEVELDSLLHDMDEVPSEERLEKLVEKDNVMSTSMLNEESLIEVSMKSTEVPDENNSEEFNVDRVIGDRQLEEHRLVEFKEDLNLLQRNIDHLLSNNEESSIMKVIKNEDEFNRDHEGYPISEIGINRKERSHARQCPFKNNQHATGKLDKLTKIADLQIGNENTIEVEEPNSAETTDTHMPVRELSPNEEKEILQKQYSSLMKHAAEYLLKLKGNINDTEVINEMSNDASFEDIELDTFQIPLRKLTLVERKSALEGQYISLMNHAAKMYWQLRD